MTVRVGTAEQKSRFESLLCEYVSYWWAGELSWSGRGKCYYDSTVQRWWQEFLIFERVT
jgi:hypothetical protein